MGSSQKTQLDTENIRQTATITLWAGCVMLGIGLTALLDTFKIGAFPAVLIGFCLAVGLGGVIIATTSLSQVRK